MLLIIAKNLINPHKILLSATCYHVLLLFFGKKKKNSAFSPQTGSTTQLRSCARVGLNVHVLPARHRFWRTRALLGLIGTWAKEIDGLVVEIEGTRIGCSKIYILFSGFMVRMIWMTKHVFVSWFEVFPGRFAVLGDDVWSVDVFWPCLSKVSKVASETVGGILVQSQLMGVGQNPSSSHEPEKAFCRVLGSTAIWLENRLRKTRQHFWNPTLVLSISARWFQVCTWYFTIVLGCDIMKWVKIYLLEMFTTAAVGSRTS